MILTLDERTKIKDSIERSLGGLKEGAEKQIIMIVLALISDLEEMERTQAGCIEARLVEAIKSLHSKTFTVDEKYLNSFSTLADTLNALSVSVGKIKVDLETFYFSQLAEQNSSDIPCQ